MNNPRLEMFEALLERVREMRENMETLAKDLSQIGVTDLSFESWRNKIDVAEQQILNQINRLRSAP